MPSVDGGHRISAKLAAFGRSLRDDHEFGVGSGHTLLALRALDVVGATNVDRTRAALRAIFCSSPDQVGVFDALFEAYFLRPEGVKNPLNQARHTRPGDSSETPGRPKTPNDASARSEGERGSVPQSAQTPAAGMGDPLSSWRAMLAQYSPHAGRSGPPDITLDEQRAMLEAASDLIAGVMRGRSRRWRPQLRGPRLDVRRTLRHSLRTGGDPTTLRRLGHPRRNPRFVVIIDGSRSMAECVQPILAFSAALCRRSRRVGVFMFSTGMRDVTRAVTDRPDRLQHLGDAWGGGTRIGNNLHDFVRGRGRRLLGADSIAIVFSDGIDAGESERLTRAMRELHRKAAGVVWINPHAGNADYKPETGGMRAALPYIDLLAGPHDAAGYRELAKRVARVI